MKGLKPKQGSQKGTASDFSMIKLTEMKRPLVPKIDKSHKGYGNEQYNPKKESLSDL